MKLLLETWSSPSSLFYPWCISDRQKGDAIGALEIRLKMFDKYNEYTGKGIILNII